MLFGHLHDDAFLIFSRAHKHLFARILIDLFRDYFSDTVSFPTRTEVVRAVYDSLRAHPELWYDGQDDDIAAAPDVRVRGRRLQRRPAGTVGADAQDDITERAWRIYNRLLDTGWLEEEAYGLRITVDMPPAALLLMDRLAALEGGLGTSIRGVVSIIRSSLSRALADLETDDAATQAPGAAAGVHKAAEMAIAFSRDLRMVLATLRGIERDILASDTIKARMGMFFEDFIGRLVLKDFESIYKTNHPYRYKAEILRLLDGLEDTERLRALMLDGYVGAELCPDTVEAGRQLDHDAHVLRRVFDRVDLTYERINTFRARLETRLRNTVRYADLGDQRHARRLGALIGRLDAVATAADGLALPLPDPTLPVFEHHAPWAPDALREPPAPPHPVTSDAVRTRSPDPVLAAYRGLIRQYNDLFIMPPQQVMRFLERRIPPNGAAEARDLPLDSVADILAFEHLRRYRHGPPPAFTRHFILEPCRDGSWRDDDWLRCENFIVRRTDDHVTLTGDAGS